MFTYPYKGIVQIQERYDMFLDLKDIASKQLEEAKERVHFLKKEASFNFIIKLYI